MSVCVAGGRREKWDRTQHHHWEKTGPSASWCHRGNDPSLWQWPSDSRAAAVSPLDLWEPPVRLWVDSHSGCTFQWGVNYLREPMNGWKFEIQFDKSSWWTSHSVLSHTVSLSAECVTRLQCFVGSGQCCIVEGSKFKSKRSGGIGRFVGAICPHTRPEHETDLPQSCCTRRPKHRSASIHNIHKH